METLVPRLCGSSLELPNTLLMVSGSIGNSPYFLAQACSALCHPHPLPHYPPHTHTHAKATFLPPSLTQNLPYGLPQPCSILLSGHASSGLSPLGFYVQGCKSSADRIQRYVWLVQAETLWVDCRHRWPWAGPCPGLCIFPPSCPLLARCWLHSPADFMCPALLTHRKRSLPKSPNAVLSS